MQIIKDNGVFKWAVCDFDIYTYNVSLRRRIANHNLIVSRIRSCPFSLLFLFLSLFYNSFVRLSHNLVLIPFCYSKQWSQCKTHRDGGKLLRQFGPGMINTISQIMTRDKFYRFFFFLFIYIFRTYLSYHILWSVFSNEPNFFHIYRLYYVIRHRNLICHV